MTKIRKEQIQDHIVIPDTNILWSEDKTIIVNPEFDKFWEIQSKLVQLNLSIPSVVKGELLFLINKSAFKAIEKIKENNLKLSQITSFNYKNIIKESLIKNYIEKKFNRWLNGKNGSILEIPVTEIDWLRLCNNAIWRVKPFIEEADKENEKGFRDAIILEIVINSYHNKKEDEIIVFLCNDGVLKECVENRLRNKSDLLIFDSVNDFSSYLKLRHEKLTKEFVKAISKKAKDKFFSPKDKGSLFYKEKILERVRKEFESDLNHPEETENYQSALSKLVNKAPEKWQPIAEAKWWILSPTFDRIEEEINYHWISEILYIKNYQKEISDISKESMSLLGFIQPRQSSIIRFNVFWKSIVRKDGKFYSCEIDRIEIAKKEFKFPSQEEIEKYKINIF